MSDEDEATIGSGAFPGLHTCNVGGVHCPLDRFGAVGLRLWCRSTVATSYQSVRSSSQWRGEGHWVQQQIVCVFVTAETCLICSVRPNLLALQIWCLETGASYGCLAYWLADVVGGTGSSLAPSHRQRTLRSRDQRRSMTVRVAVARRYVVCLVSWGCLCSARGQVVAAGCMLKYYYACVIHE